KFILIYLSSFLSSVSLQASYKALIFDVDGVLVDTEQLKFEAWQQALKEKEVEFQLDEYYPLVGGSSEAILNSINQQKNVQLGEEVIAIKEKYYYEKQIEGVPLIQDAVKFLKEVICLRKSGKIKLALASSAPYDEIIRNIKQMNLSEEDFDLIASGKDSLKHINDYTGVNKPKPYIYQFCAQKLNVQPFECLVFEDTYAGVIAATRAGMNAIAVPNKFTINHEFSKAMKVASFNSLKLNSIVNANN
uniref:HAD family hydrolase n=1 Tax=Candidatus Paracaedibacter symbiosus TaxID=244582 RepID=UPI0012ECA75C